MKRPGLTVEACSRASVSCWASPACPRRPGAPPPRTAPPGHLAHVGRCRAKRPSLPACGMEPWRGLLMAFVLLAVYKVQVSPRLRPSPALWIRPQARGHGHFHSFWGQTVIGLKALKDFRSLLLRIILLTPRFSSRSG